MYTQTHITNIKVYDFRIRISSYAFLDTSTKEWLQFDNILKDETPHTKNCYYFVIDVPNTHTHPDTHSHTHVCVCACLCVYMFACPCVSMCAFLFLYVWYVRISINFWDLVFPPVYTWSFNLDVWTWLGCMSFVYIENILLVHVFQVFLLLLEDRVCLKPILMRCFSWSIFYCF